MTRLGAFELQALLAQGGMGSVWRARHHRTHLPVAIKLLRTDRGDPTVLARLIDREARALARLDHPRIVALLDWGRVDFEAAAATAPAGSPYLVLEFVGGGDLSAHEGALGWQDLRRVLLAVLDGLAHAHAHDVVHLDIKPANVLLVAGLDTLLEPKLTDFGIARRLDQVRAGGAIAGTPGFMAPEMAAGHWRQLGPWTDLYAISGLARFLLRPDSPIPLGLADWLECMSAPSPSARFLHAAHAAHALRQLGGAETELAPAIAALGAQTWFLDQPFEIPREPAHSRPTLPRLFPLDPPETWRTPAAPAPNRSLPDTGAAVMAIRRPSLLVRDPERDQIWSALCRAATRSTVIELSGAPGMGGDALAEWAVLRCRELGVALTLVVRLDQDDTLARALQRSLRAWFHLDGLGVAAAEARAESLAALLGVQDPASQQALSRLTAWCASDSAHLPLADFHQVLASFSHVRPILLWLDLSAASAPDLTPLAPLFRSPRVRILGLVTTSNTGAQVEDAPVPAMAQTAERIELGPLSDQDIVTSLTRTSSLQPSAALQIAEAAGGNPGRAHALLVSIAGAGELEPGRDGMTLSVGSRIGRPTTPLEEERIDAALSALQLHERDAIEIAALLGREVDRRLWARAAELLPTGDALAGLAGFVLRDQDSQDGPLRFWSVGARQVVLSRMRDRGAEMAHRRAVAAALEAVAQPAEAAVHWLALGELDRAWDNLVEGIREAFHQRSTPLVRAWIAHLEDVCALADWPGADPRRAEPDYLRAFHLMTLSRVPEATVLGVALLERAQGEGWGRFQGRTCWLLGRCAIYQGATERADSFLAQGLALARTAGDGLTEGRCLVDRGRVALERGDLDGARALLEQGTPIVETHKPIAGVLGYQLLADAACRAGDFDAAFAHADRARDLESGADPAFLHSHRILRGSILVAAGQVDEAERIFRDMSTNLDPYVTADSAIAMVNLALLLLDREAWTEACDELERAVAAYRIGSRTNLEATCHALLLEPLAALGDRTAFLRHLGAAERLLPATGYRHESVQRSLGRASHRVATIGWDELDRVRRLEAGQAFTPS